MFKLIACNVFLREACGCIATSPHRIDPEFTELGEHAHSQGLRQTLQARIDAAEASGKEYEAILLLFGLCGNATVGLSAKKTRLVIPRAHDCCTILLGSRQKFKEHFQAAPSTPFSSSGYMERGEYFLRTEEGQSVLGYGDAYAAYVQQYGEDNARYIWEAMHPSRPEEQGKAVFIDLPQTASLGLAQRFQTQARQAGKEFLCLEGNIRLIRNLIHGRWDPEEFLIVEAGQRIAGVYDWDEIVRAKEQ